MIIIITTTTIHIGLEPAFMLGTLPYFIYSTWIIKQKIRLYLSMLLHFALKFSFFFFIFSLDLVSTTYSSVRRHSQDWRNNQSCKEGDGFCKQHNSICQRPNSLQPSHSFASDLLWELCQATQPLSSSAVLWKALFYPKIKAVTRAR